MSSSSSNRVLLLQIPWRFHRLSWKFFLCWIITLFGELAFVLVQYLLFYQPPWRQWQWTTTLMATTWLQHVACYTIFLYSSSSMLILKFSIAYPRSCCVLSSFEVADWFLFTKGGGLFARMKKFEYLLHARRNVVGFVSDFSVQFPHNRSDCVLFFSNPVTFSTILFILWLNCLNSLFVLSRPTAKWIPVRRLARKASA